MIVNIDNFDNVYNEAMSSFDESILLEAKGVFRKKGFIAMIEFIKSIENNNGKTLSIDDVHRLGFKFYSNVIHPDKKLVICKCDFNSLRSVKRAMLLADENYLIPDDSLERSVKNLKYSKGSFTTYSDKVCAIFVKNDNQSPDDTICHELIHYIQDMTGQSVGVLTKYLTDFMDDNNTKFFPIEILAQAKRLETFGMINKEMSPWMFNDREIIPYINNLCYFFETLNVQDPLKKVNELIVEMNSLKQNKSPMLVLDFIAYMKEDEVLKHLFDGNERLNLVAILFICLFFNQHRTVLKKTVGNYFNKQRK